MKNCTHCGKNQAEEAKFCTSCGMSFKQVPLEGTAGLSRTQNIAHLFIAIASIVVIVFGIIGAWYYVIPEFMSPLQVPVASQQQVQEKPPSISNPDYLKNPSAYLVDYDNKIDSRIPRGNALWVEEVINSNTLKVSYTIVRAETNIIKVQKLSIPWLGDLAKDRNITQDMAGFLWSSSEKGKCWENGAKEFLASNLLHTEVYLVEDTHSEYRSVFDSVVYYGRLLVMNANKKDTADVAVLVIQNGYGGVISEFDLDRYARNEHPDLRTYYQELQDIEGVVSLAKKGLWGICK